MSKELTLKGNYDMSAPSQMTEMSKVLQSHISSQGLTTNIMGKSYVQVEGWQFAGGLMGTYPKIVKIENLSSGTEKKWITDVEIVRLKDNVVIGFGSALCSNLEGKKKSFDEYAILSMSQTRAIGKAYRNVIGWVMRLSGYESTPSEEMTNFNAKQTEPAKKQQETPSYSPTVDYMTQLKSKLTKLGAKTEFQALKILKDKTGLEWKDLKNKTPKMCQIALAKLLNS